MYLKLLAFYISILLVNVELFAESTTYYPKKRKEYFIKKSKAKTLNIPQDSVHLNPYGTAPLTALVRFQTKKKGYIKIRVVGQDGEASDITHQFDKYGTRHEVPILGLYPDYENQVELMLVNKKGKIKARQTLNIKTDTLPKEYNKPVEIIINKLPKEDKGVYLDITSRVAFDKFGKIRWYYKGTKKTQVFRKTLDRKNLLCLRGYRPAKVSIISLLGELLESYPYKLAGRHDVRELPSGNFIVAASKKGPGTEDMVIEIDKNTKKIINTWDFTTILDTTRKHNYGAKQKNDWLHMNCIFYDEKDEALIISGRHQNAVVKINIKTNKIKWILGPHYNWKPKFRKYLLKPTNFKQSEFNWGQHSPLVLPNSNILLFNNGNFRSIEKGVTSPTYSNVVEYKIDEEKMTVELVWQYGKERGIFTKARGDVDYLEASGNRLISFMSTSPTKSTPLIIEINSKNEVLFEAIFDRDVKHYRIEKVNFY